MAGHSKWANIKHRKGKQDAAKGAVFTKLGREIIVAAKTGGPNPDTNFRLKMAITKAKSSNMPNDNIKRAIEKGIGGGDDAQYEELIYEGYGPGGAAVMIEAMTDNRNRTAGEIRHMFSKNQGNMGESGCVSWMFQDKGVLTIELDALPFGTDETILKALDYGVDDVVEEEEALTFYTAPDVFESLKESLEKAGLVFSDAEVTKVPENTVMIEDADQAKALLRLMEMLEDHDDVQNTYTNFEFSEEIVAQLT